MAGRPLAADPLHLVQDASGTRLKVRVIPPAGRTAVAGLRGDALLCRLIAPPVDDAANDALMELLADVFGVGPRAIRIVKGKHARTKEVVIGGVSPDDVTTRLRPHLNPKRGRESPAT